MGDTHALALAVVDCLENLLEQHGIIVPDDDRPEDNDAPLYGATYANFVDEIESLLHSADRHSTARINEKIQRDAVSRKHIVREILAERDRHPPMIQELGVPVRCRYNEAIRGGLRKALRAVEKAPSIFRNETPGAWLFPDKNVQNCRHLAQATCGCCITRVVVDVRNANFCPECGEPMNPEGLYNV